MNSSKTYILLILILVSLPMGTFGENNAAPIRARSRNLKSPNAIGRAADPDIPSAASIPAVIHSVSPGNAALAMIQFPWQDLGYRISFLGRRPGFRALTFVDEHRIEVYVKTGDAPSELAFDLAHEFGHVVDLKFNDQARRRRWMELRGIDPDTAWFGASACSDFNTPAGDFAETFAYLLLGPGSYHSRMAPPPTPEQVKELAEFCHISHISDALVAGN